MLYARDTEHLYRFADTLARDTYRCTQKGRSLTDLSIHAAALLIPRNVLWVREATGVEFCMIKSKGKEKG